MREGEGERGKHKETEKRKENRPANRQIDKTADSVGE